VAAFDRAVSPGGEGKITITIDTTGFQGRISKEAVVTTNDPDRRTAQVTLSAEVRPLILVEPASRVILHGIVGDEVRQVLKLRAAAGEPLRIDKVETDLEGLVQHTVRPADGGRAVELAVSCRAARKETAQGYLRLYTNHPAKKKLELPVHVRIKPELEVLPEEVVFDGALRGKDQGAPPKRVLILVNNRGEGFKISGLRYNRDYFQVDALPPTDTPPSRYRVEIVPRLDRLPARGAKVEDTLVITTDLARAGELKVPMRIKLES